MNYTRKVRESERTRGSTARLSHSLPFKLLAALGVVAVAAIGSFAGPAAPAFAAPTAAVTIERTSVSPQESGEVFSYNLMYECSDVDGAGCDNSVITIPLGAAASFSVDVSTAAPVASWTIVGSDLVITLNAAIDAGTSSTIQLLLTPPNNITPDGTTWSLLPTVTGSNIPTYTAPAPADGTATAVLAPTISKTVVPAFAQPGDSATWTIVVGCYLLESGSLFAQSMTVTDTLPSGFDFVSASGGGVFNAADGTIVWTYPDLDSVPEGCSDAGSTGTITQTITGNVSPSQAPNVSLVNTASVSAVPYGGGDPVVADDDASITVWDEANPPGPGPISMPKVGQGQIVGPNQASNLYCPTSSCFGTTYPGNWMGVPKEAHTNQGAPGWPVVDPASLIWSGYTTQVYVEGDGFQNEFRDEMPCIDNYDEPLYSASAGICQNPAFHATMITVYNQPASGHSNGNWVSSLVPYAILTDGSVVDLVLQGSPPANAYMAFYDVPASAIGRVAEIVVPRNAGATAFLKRYYVGGYADKSIPDGSILENYSETDLYWHDSAVATSATSTRGLIFVINAPQIGAEKSFGEIGQAEGGATALTIGGRLLTIGEPSEDLVITDLLPEGITLASSSSTTSLSYDITTGDESGQVTNSSSADFPMEVIDNYQGSGRQLVRITVDQAFLLSQAGLSSAESGTAYAFRTNSLTVSTPTEPGVYNNRASVFYDREDIAATCSSFLVQAPNDSGDLDGNGDTTDHHCDATATLTVPGTVAGPAFSLKKTVQGSSDAFPKAWPSVARVEAAGGTVDFGVTWKNVALVPLNDVVLYDVFPRVDDTGVSASLASQGRYSDFAPLLTGVGTLPAGVSIAYSTAQNPCRNEVYPNSVNTTCLDDWAATAPADLTTVTAIRLTSSNTYAAGEGFTVNISMTTPSISDGDIAWNSVAGRADNATTSEPLLASEPPKVGITAVGTDLPPEIQKTVDKATAAPGDTLTYTMRVANLDVVRLTGLEAVDTLPAGVTFVSADNGGVHNAANGTIVWSDFTLESGEYKTFTVQVTVNEGTSGQLTNKFEMDGALANFRCVDDPDASCAVTEIPGGELIVRKDVTGDAAAYGTGPFTVAVDCRAAGASVPGFPQDVVFTGAGDSAPIPAPIGSVCSASETNAGGATAITVTPEDGVTIVAGAADGPAITVTNEFRAGQLVISKGLDGAGAAEFGDGPFVFGVICSFDGEDSVYSSEVQLQRTGDEATLTSAPITGLPIGAECVVTETGNGGADATPAPVTVTISENDTANTVTAAFVNEFSAGTISLSKVLAGSAADTRDATESVFTVQITCQVELPGDPPTTGTLFSGAVQIRGGETVDVEDAEGNPVLLPVGARCWGEETDQGGAHVAAVNFDSFENAAVVAAGDPDELQELQLTATNTFNAAQFVVTKTVVGPGAAGPYSFSVECTNGDIEYLLAEEDAQFTLRHGESRTIVVSEGVDCVATELSPPTGATVSVVDSDDSSEGGAGDGIVLNITGEARADFTNTFKVIPGMANTGLVVTGSVIGGVMLLLGGGALLLLSRKRHQAA